MPADKGPFQPPDWAILARDLEGRWAEDLESSRGVLRGLVCEASLRIGSAESSLLVPDSSGEQLEFLVSVNADLESSDTRVPCDRSIAGYVFTTGQLIAVEDVAEEMADRHYDEIDRKTGVVTHTYLAAPVFREESVLGVLTFVNRPEGETARGFDGPEIEAAQSFAALCSAALRSYQRHRYQVELSRGDLSRVLEEIEGESFQDPMERQDDPALDLLRSLEGLSEKEWDLYSELLETVRRHSGR